MERSVADTMGRPRQPEEMLPLLTRHEVQVLLRAGHTQRDVAARTGVSIRAIRRIASEERPKDADDARERKVRRIGRPSKAEPFRTFAVELLTKEPDLMSLEGHPAAESGRRANRPFGLLRAPRSRSPGSPGSSSGPGHRTTIARVTTSAPRANCHQGRARPFD